MHNLCIGYNNGNAYRINFVFMSKNDALKMQIKKEHYKRKKLDFTIIKTIN